jgi:transcriptional regulator with XRE-family HTH domain
MPPPRKTPPRSRQHAAFGEAVRRRRLELGWSLRELSERVFTDEKQVGGIERGTRNPSLQVVFDLESVLEIKLGELFSLYDQILDEGQS